MYQLWSRLLCSVYILVYVSCLQATHSFDTRPINFYLLHLCGRRLFCLGYYCDHKLYHTTVFEFCSLQNIPWTNGSPSPYKMKMSCRFYWTYWICNFIVFSHGKLACCAASAVWGERSSFFIITLWKCVSYTIFV